MECVTVTLLVRRCLYKWKKIYNNVFFSFILIIIKHKLWYKMCEQWVWDRDEKTGIKNKNIQWKIHFCIQCGLFCMEFIEIKTIFRSSLCLYCGGGGMHGMHVFCGYKYVIRHSRHSYRPIKKMFRGNVLDKRIGI